MSTRDATPYDAFEPAEVERAEVEMRRDKLARDLGRPLTDEDTLIWLRSREALPRVGECTAFRKGDKVAIGGTITKDGRLYLTQLAAVDLCRDLMRLLIERT